MRIHLTVHSYCVLIFVAACAATAAVMSSIGLGFVVEHPVTFGLLSTGLLLAEMLPVKVTRRGGNEEITLSTSFAVAMLLVAGPGPALVSQGIACVIQDVASRKPWWRAVFNLSQLTLAMIVALLVLRATSAASGLGSNHPFSSAQLPAVLLAALGYFIVNTGSVGVAVALYQKTPLRRYFRNELSFVITTAGVLLLLAPIVVATTIYSPFLVPLLGAPLLALHQALRQGARSEHAARHDSLTGLPNRVAFKEAADRLIGEDNSRFSILLMDLDRFKEVNDTLGHHYGDLLLRQVAARIRGELRDGDQVARLGGDEFAVLSSGGDDPPAVARRIINSLSSRFELEHIVLEVQASIGIAVFPEDGTDVDTLLQRADVAMYHAKGSRAGVARYDERHDHHSPAKLALSADLRGALDGHEMSVHYQPELNLSTGQAFAVEALARWEHPKLGTLPPARFIEMAEHLNLIKPLTHRVLDVALRQLSRWRAMGIDVSVAVNISTAVLIDRAFTQSVVGRLRELDLPPSRLKLEVTESTLMSDPEVTSTILQDLHRLGIEISIDDFGTGYSSLAYLADLPVSEIKIDRSFVGRMAMGGKEAIIVNSTIDLAHHLGLRAVAEGVEDQATLDRLRTLRCDAAQGYLVGRPMPSDAATQWLLETESAIASPDPDGLLRAVV